MNMKKKPAAVERLPDTKKQQAIERLSEDMLAYHSQLVDEFNAAGLGLRQAEERLRAAEDSIISLRRTIDQRYSLGPQDRIGKDGTIVRGALNPDQAAG